MMLMEYKIVNKVNSILPKSRDDKMNNILIHTDNEKVMHVIKESCHAHGWHKNIVSIGISDNSEPQMKTKASFESKEKLKTLISILQSHLSEMN